MQQYNHITIKMKPVDVKPNTCSDSSKDSSKGDIDRISKYKNIYAKDFVPNRCEEVCVIKKVKNTVPWT